jgi:hypothetical protein
VPPCINKGLNPKCCGHVFCSGNYSAGGRTRPILSAVLDTLSDGPSAVCDVTGSEMFQLERCLTVNETVLHTFVCKLMKSDRFLPFL